jgi:hypothetical protein
MKYASLRISLGRIPEIQIIRTCDVVQIAQMLARSGGRACLQKAELPHWRGTLRKLIFTKPFECSGLENVTGWRRHENDVNGLQANSIGDNQEIACALHFQHLCSFRQPFELM